MRGICEYVNMRIWTAVVLTCFVIASCFSEKSPAEVDVAAICSVPVAELQEGGAFVPVRGFDFLIDTLRVAQGTRVTWINCEQPPGEGHTVTSDTGVFDSPLFGEGQTYSRVFDTRGTFPYHCVPHPSMRAVVIVQ